MSNPFITTHPTFIQEHQRTLKMLLQMFLACPSHRTADLLNLQRRITQKVVLIRTLVEAGNLEN